MFVKSKIFKYPIIIKDQSLKNYSKKLRSCIKEKRILVLSNKNILRLYGKKLRRELKNKKINLIYKIIPDGEIFKTEKTLISILKTMAINKFNRDSALISLGGGVIGDLGGLAASLFMRGINHYQFPTTLLSQIDASIGGKTGIDFFGIKNLIGSFYPPKGVFIDTTVLKTLPDRQFRTGLAEIIKYGVIADKNLFNVFLETQPEKLIRDKKLLKYVVSNSCAIKANIVSLDEREKGLRKKLNFGHTLGHALESYYGYKLLTHGEAISYGMLFAARLSLEIGITKIETPQIIKQVLLKYNLLKPIPKYVPEELVKKISMDKKASNSGIQFILTRKIGLVSIQNYFTEKEIIRSLYNFQKEVQEISSGSKGKLYV